MFSLALLYSYTHRTVHLNNKCYLVHTLQHNEIKGREDERPLPVLILTGFF